MSDEPAKFILGDTAINAGGNTLTERGFFGAGAAAGAADSLRELRRALTGRYAPNADNRRSTIGARFDMCSSMLLDRFSIGD